MNKNIRNLLIIIIVVAIIVVGGFFVFKNVQENDISKLEVYNYEEDPNYTKCTEIEGVEFSYPSNYESYGNSTQPTFRDPDIVGASVNLVSENAQNLSLENYIKASMETVKSSLDVQGDIQEQYINLNGTKAAKIEYIAKQNNVDIKLTQVAIIKSGNAYILTIGCLPDDSEKIQEKEDKIIKSFR